MKEVDLDNKITKALAKRLVEFRMVLYPNSASAFAKTISIPQTTWSGYERGTRNIPNELYDKLSKPPYNVNLNWLFTGEGEMFLSSCKNTLEKCDNKDLTKNTDTFYKRFNQIQKENDLNDYQLSKLTGIDEMRIEKLGIGKVLPTLEELNALKSQFDVSIDWLLYGETPRKNAQSEINTLSAEEIIILKKLAQKTNF